jgi:hypothetical protein
MYSSVNFKKSLKYKQQSHFPRHGIDAKSIFQEHLVSLLEAIEHKLHLHVPSYAHGLLRLLRLGSLAVSLSRVVTTNANQILWSVVVSTREVRVQDGLGTGCISLLRIDRCTAHMRHHCVSAAHGVLSVSERVVLWCGLREPHITTVAVQVA